MAEGMSFSFPSLLFHEGRTYGQLIKRKVPIDHIFLSASNSIRIVPLPVPCIFYIVMLILLLYYSQNICSFLK